MHAREGVGLVYSKRAIEAHGVTTTVASEDGTGTISYSENTNEA